MIYCHSLEHNQPQSYFLCFTETFILSLSGWYPEGCFISLSPHTKGTKCYWFIGFYFALWQCGQCNYISFYTSSILLKLILVFFLLAETCFQKYEKNCQILQMFLYFCSCWLACFHYLEQSFSEKGKLASYSVLIILTKCGRNITVNIIIYQNHLLLEMTIGKDLIFVLFKQDPYY